MERSVVSINNQKYQRNRPSQELRLVVHREAVVDVEAKYAVDLKFLI
jgi:hypothetical protein